MNFIKVGERLVNLDHVVCVSPRKVKNMITGKEMVEADLVVVRSQHWSTDAPFEDIVNKIMGDGRFVKMEPKGGT